jgi:FkbM family methyltransferase
MSETLARDVAFKSAWEQLERSAELRSREWLLHGISTGVWIYGAGHYGQTLANLIEKLSLPVMGFIDKRGDSLGALHGKPVFAPGAITPEMVLGKSLVIGILNPSLYADQILPFAEKLPFGKVLWNADLPEALGPNANTMWLSSRSFLCDHRDQIQQVIKTLGDQKSFDTYLSLILYRSSGLRSDHPEFDAPRQYLPNDLPGFDRPIQFIDGGAYIGDTMVALHQLGVEFSGWYAFEPDAANFKGLAETARDSGIPAYLYPCGLADGVYQLRFEESLGVGSKLTQEESARTITIQCVAIDDALPNISPDFIKLDVEGAEISALNGMARIIAQHRPRLAVSGYHKPQDLWEIPLKLCELLPKARLYVRQHGINGFETVFYVISHNEGH